MASPPLVTPTPAEANDKPAAPTASGRAPGGPRRKDEGAKAASGKPAANGTANGTPPEANGDATPRANGSSGGAKKGGAGGGKGRGSGKGGSNGDAAAKPSA